MTDDSPAVIQYNSDGYELPVLDGESATNVPAILSGGVDGYSITHPIAIDTLGNTLVKEQNKLVPQAFDFIGFTYIPPKLKLVSTMTYRTGGPFGSVVAVVTFTYDSKDNVETMTRT